MHFAAWVKSWSDEEEEEASVELGRGSEAAGFIEESRWNVSLVAGSVMVLSV